MKYDNYAITKPTVIPCNHEFVKYEGIIREYSPELCELIINHGRQGKFIEGFFGKYNICTDEFCKWLSNKEDKPEYRDFQSAVKISISASIHYWNEVFNFAIDNFIEYAQIIPVIRNILSDIMKSTPKELRENLYDNLQRETADEKSKKVEMKEELDFFAAIKGEN